MKETVTFKGTFAYVSSKPRQFKEGDQVWMMNFYPDDAAGRKAVKATGIKNNAKEDDGEKSGIPGLYFILRSKSPYEIVDGDGQPITDMVGNGSKGVVELEIERFESQKYGPQTRSTLLRVIVTDFVPYVPKTDGVSRTELPA